MKYRHEQLSIDLHNKLGLHLKGNTLETGAAKLGFSKATLSRVINGHMPDLMNYARICKFLNKPMNTYIK